MQSCNKAALPSDQASPYDIADIGCFLAFRYIALAPNVSPNRFLTRYRKQLPINLERKIAAHNLGALFPAGMKLDGINSDFSCCIKLQDGLYVRILL